MVQKLLVGGIVFAVLGISLMAKSFGGQRYALDYHAEAHPEDAGGPCVGQGQDVFVWNAYTTFRDKWFPGLMIVAVSIAMIGAGMIFRTRAQLRGEPQGKEPPPPPESS